MPTDHQIAVLCDIGQSMAFDDDKLADVERLIIDGYVQKNGDLLELTPKGENLLTQRGAGLNES